MGAARTLPLPRAVQYTRVASIAIPKGCSSFDAITTGAPPSGTPVFGTLTTLAEPVKLVK